MSKSTFSYYASFFEVVSALASFDISTPQIIYPFTEIGDRFRTLLLGGFGDDASAANGITFFVDFSEDGVTPDLDRRQTLVTPGGPGHAILQIDDVGPKYIRITAQSNKAGSAQVTGRWVFKGRRPDFKLGVP